MTSYDVNSGDDSVLAVKINSTQTTGIKIAAMTINGTTTAWANQSGGVIEIVEEVEGTKKREWISYTGGTENADSSFTPSGVSRDVSRTASSLTGSGTGQSFNKGASVRFVNFHYIYNQKADVDRANTFTADQTFDDDILFTNTDKVGLNARPLTTSEKNAISSPANGGIVYDETLGQMSFREGGAWVANAAGGSVADATESVAGKVELSTPAENAAATATGGTGAGLVVRTEDCVQVSGDSGVAEGAVPVLNSSSKVDVTLLGTGTPSSSNFLRGDGSWVDVTRITKWFGTGADGAKTVSASENLDPTADFNYTTLTVAAGQTLSVSSVNTPLIVRCTGDATINGKIDLDGKGGAGSSGGAAGGGSPSAGTAGASMVSGITNGAGGAAGASTNGGRGGAGGAGYAADGSNGASGGTGGSSLSDKNAAWLSNVNLSVICGGGGSGGAGDDVTDAGGAGGAGGGAMLLYVAGDLTLGASSEITADGIVGGSGGATGGGGGGGGGGTVVIVVGGTITDGGVTKTAAAGGAGSGGTNGGAGGAGKLIIYSLEDNTVISA